MADLVKAHQKTHIKVVGTAHSFNDIADTDGIHVNLAKFNDIRVDKATNSVTFGAGVTYSMLLEVLQREGMSIPNLPSLPHLNIVGSVTTGTHGGGVENGAMATYVHKINYVDSKGSLSTKKIIVDKDFKMRLHAFGTLGIIYEMTMAIFPEYGVKKCIYENVPWDFLKDKK